MLKLLRKHPFKIIHKHCFYSSKLPSHELILMPSLSPTMEAGNLGKWKKKVGDKINIGDVLVEIETDKALMDFEFQDEGYLANIIVSDDTKDVKVSDPIAVMVQDKELIDQFKDYKPTNTKEQDTIVKKKEQDTKEKESTKQEDSNVQNLNISSNDSKTSIDRTFITPFAKKLANQMGIDLDVLKQKGIGTNYKNPITETHLKDIEPTETSSETKTSSKDVNELLYSKRNIPHYHLNTKIKINNKESIQPLIIKAVGIANNKIKEVNSKFDNTSIKQYKKINIKYVKVDKGNSVKEVVIGDANLIGLNEIKNIIHNTIDTEAKESTFKIVDLMDSDIQMLSEIVDINHCCVLTIGCIETTLNLNHENKILEEHYINVGMSCDHRVVDGALGAQYLKLVKQHIEKPMSMLD